MTLGAVVRICFLRTTCCVIITHISHSEAGISQPRCGKQHDRQEDISPPNRGWHVLKGFKYVYISKYSVTLFLSLLFNFPEVTRGTQSASYRAESDLIISSIKAEISLKINALALYCLLCTRATRRKSRVHCLWCSGWNVESLCVWI